MEAETALRCSSKVAAWAGRASDPSIAIPSETPNIRAPLTEDLLSVMEEIELEQVTSFDLVMRMMI
jgi:hypothetical protein